MNVSLHQLRIFVAVAEELNFSRAAEVLLLSQPAVSMQIKAVEQAAGSRLFDRLGRRLQLTDAGRVLYANAREVLIGADEMSESMSQIREGRSGRLRVIATTTVGIYIVPNLLGAYHERHPGIEIQLEVANWETTVDRLFAGEADVAIAGPHPQPGLKMEPFMDDRLVVIASPRHPLAGLRDIPLATLAKEPMLVRERGSGTRAAVERLFATQGLLLRRAMELSQNGAVKQVAQAGLGVAVISRGAISLEVTNGTLSVLDVEGFPIVRTWNIITHPSRTLPRPAVDFCAEISAP